MDIKSRLFIVGSSRSGTTLLQHHLAQHPSIFSLPETDFFGKLLNRKSWRWFGLGQNRWVSRRRAARAFSGLQQILGDPTLNWLRTGRVIRTRHCVDTFVQWMDKQTRNEGKVAWVEKTPRHFRFVNEIERYVPDAQIIHMIRDGRAVAASIRDRAHRFGSKFGHETDLRYGVQLWNDAVQTALRRRRVGKDMVVFYEEFVSEPERVLKAICDQIELEYEAHMLATSGDPSRVVTDSELWKGQVSGGIGQASSKFDDVFSDEEKERVVSLLDWESFSDLQESNAGFS